MRIHFHDRHDAGRQLGDRLRFQAYDHVVVLGVPRGGVPVAYEVASTLEAPLDVFVVRKLGVPGHEEVAMGAIAPGGVRVLVPEVVQGLTIAERKLDLVTAVERRELDRRLRVYRGDRPFPALAGSTVILVDDGAATGASMVAAISALRKLRPGLIVAAVPVMSRSARDTICDAADVCETLSIPEPFMSVGSWYDNFGQTTDAEVRALLAARMHSGAMATELVHGGGHRGW